MDWQLITELNMFLFKKMLPLKDIARYCRLILLTDIAIKETCILETVWIPYNNFCVVSHPA